MAEKHVADAESQFIVSNCTPDFCRVGKEVIPFDIAQVLTPEKAAYATTVFARGQPVLMIDSIIRAVTGNAGKGVKSGVSLANGDSRITQGSSTVFTEGRCTARHLDEVLMNGVFPAAPKPASSVKTGLGGPVDQLVVKSPTLQKDLEKLKADGWVIEYGPAGKGSFASRDTVPPRIVLDGALKDNPLAATQVLAHEVGHATYPYVQDGSTKAAYVNGALADEGAATMKNIQVQREIIANGGSDIGIAGDPKNHAVYNKAVDVYMTNGDAAAARNAIGQQIGHGEMTSTSGQPYSNYYGDWYDKTYPSRK
jgi:type VI secretion system secreted protein VgrG